MIGDSLYLKGRPWRHGYRVEGAFIERRFGKKHRFFQSEEEALKAISRDCAALRRDTE